MYRIKKNIDRDYLCELNSIEEKKKNCFIEQFERLYGSQLKHKGLECIITIIRWNEKKCIKTKKMYDGYTVMLQVDFLYKKRIIKIPADNNYYTCFQNLTYIQWKPFDKCYSIYQNDNLNELWKDVNKMFADIECYGFQVE